MTCENLHSSLSEAVQNLIVCQTYQKDYHNENMVNWREESVLLYVVLSKSYCKDKTVKTKLFDTGSQGVPFDQAFFRARECSRLGGV